jgi:phospholipid/cholesterol/gamma-HCH transport system substrate-binding protein
MNRLFGWIYLLAIVLTAAMAIAVYRKAFSPAAMVTLRTDHVGSQLHHEAEVKLRGVVVGVVHQVRTDGTGAEVELAMRPDLIGQVPRDVTAMLLPKTVLGERYVDLVPPPGHDPKRLAAGDVIGQDHSGTAIEVEQVIGDLMPMLQAVQPQKLSSILSTLAQALSGRGDQLGQTLTWLNQDLQSFQPELPSLTSGIQELASVADTYNSVTPDLVHALTDLTTTSRTIVDQRQQLTSLFQNLTTSARDLTTFLRRDGDNIIRLSTNSVPTLNLLAKYSPEYPCMLRALTAFEPVMDQVLGKGTDQPGLHVNVHVDTSRGKYLPGKDDPAYDDKGPPSCYPLTAAPNSSQESHFIGAMLGTGLPSWGSVLVGPLYRGTEVTLR